MVYGFMGDRRVGSTWWCTSWWRPYSPITPMGQWCISGDNCPITDMDGGLCPGILVLQPLWILNVCFGDNCSSGKLSSWHLRGGCLTREGGEGICLGSYCLNPVLKLPGFVVVFLCKESLQSLHTMTLRVAFSPPLFHIPRCNLHSVATVHDLHSVSTVHVLHSVRYRTPIVSAQYSTSMVSPQYTTSKVSGTLTL